MAGALTNVFPGSATLPALFAPDPAAGKRFVEFFTANIRNPNTRKAYARAAAEFAAWCEQNGLRELRDIEPVHVAAYIETLQVRLAAPSVKLHLAAIRMLFDWLVVGQVIAVNPASAVRGPKHSVKKGKTPVLSAEEARALLDSIDPSSAVALRDRALIALMVYTFARVGAALKMRVEDVYVAEAGAPGCGCTKKAASGMRCPATTISIPTSTPISTARSSPATPKDYLFPTALGRTGSSPTGQ